MTNWLDFLLFLTLLAGVTVGLLQGLLRQVMNLGAMYLGAILAAQYFHVFGKLLESQLVTTPGALLNAIAFFVVMFAVTGLLNFLSYDAYKNTKLSLFPALDRFGGMLLGLVAGWIIVTIAVSLVAFATSTQYWPSAENFRQVLKEGIRGSQLASIAEMTLPGILNALKPWLPFGIPSIFSF